MRQCRVVDPGPLTTVQDGGRPGHAHLGVPRAGVLDGPAASAANRLVGNPEDAAVLETTVGGVSFVVTEALAFAVTGAGCDIRMGGRPVAWGEAVSAGAGAEVVVGPARTGVRSYVALAGGILVPPVLGSRSTDTLAGVGPAVVRRGDVLPLGPELGSPSAAAVTPYPGGPVTLRYDPGPRHDWVAAGPAGEYVVSDLSNRVGLRLHGEPVVRSRGDELPSEGIVLGAIQVPADGQPLVFLHDHPTTGGYPVVGVVCAEDLPRCAQLAPGVVITLRPR